MSIRCSDQFNLQAGDLSRHSFAFNFGSHIGLPNGHAVNAKIDLHLFLLLTMSIMLPRNADHRPTLKVRDQISPNSLTPSLSWPHCGQTGPTKLEPVSYTHL